MSLSDLIENRSNLKQQQPFRFPTFSRIVVLDVIYDPVQMTRDRINHYYDKFNLRKTAYSSVVPRNTIIGRKILDAIGTMTETATLFLPFFPAHLSLPCKPGEHMWALLSENDQTTQEFGYWFCKITEMLHVDDLNHTHPPREKEYSFFPTKVDIDNGIKPSYDFKNGIFVKDEDGNRSLIPNSNFIPGDENAYEFLIHSRETQTNASRLIPRDSVPRYKKRPGDLVLEGSNNSLIVLGTDRRGPVADYSEGVLFGQGSLETVITSPTIPTSDLPFGSIDIVVGRGQTKETSGFKIESTGSFPFVELNKVPYQAEECLNEGDPDLINDASRARLSQKTKTDESINLSSFNSQFGINDSSDGDPSIILKSDKLRLVARRDLEIIVANDSGDESSYAAIVIKSNGDIVFRPSKLGYIKLGGDDADKGIVCSDSPVVTTNGTIAGPTLITTAGGQFAGTVITPLSIEENSFSNNAVRPGQGKYASKVLIK